MEKSLLWNKYHDRDFLTKQYIISVVSVLGSLLYFYNFYDAGFPRVGALAALLCKAFH